MKPPLISIIMPSFNQGSYIEESILSVLKQPYPSKEFIVMDGGSTDETVAILQKYDGEITFWKSAPDRGQTHAINEGFRLTKGKYVGWLNSDDVLKPDILGKIVDAFESDDEIGIVSGQVEVVHEHENGKYIRTNNGTAIDFNLILNGTFKLSQPGSFFRKAFVDALGPLDENLHYAMDYEWWLRMSQKHKVVELDCVTAMHRLHPECKSMQEFDKTFLPEIKEIRQRYHGKLFCPKSYSIWRIKLGSLRKRAVKKWQRSKR